MKTMHQYEMYEITVDGPAPEGSWVATDVHADFTNSGKTISVKGFYAGDGTYRVRFLPEQAGIYECRLYVPFGDPERVMEIKCLPAAEGRHGIVRADGTHFRYADGTWFYPFGTTVYALIHQEDALVEQTFETLAGSPFNKIRICLFPKHYDYNHNEPPCYAFAATQKGMQELQDPDRTSAPGRWDIHHPNPQFWNRLEKYIQRLDTLGIQCDLILFHDYDNWGFARLSLDEALTYLDYAARRLSAFPNLWWSLANEYDLLPYTQKDWKTIAHFIHENDPYGHLLSNHHMVREWDYANEDTTHICLQTSDLDFLSSKILKYNKPLMVDECRYEGNLPLNWGNITGFELVNRFWTVIAQGGYCTHGETFLDKNDPDEIVWWAKGGKLIGESPARIAFLRDIVESLPGPLTYAGRPETTREQFETMKTQLTQSMLEANGFLRLIVTSSWGEARALVNSARELEASCEDKAFLKYYARNCTCLGKLSLPESGSYKVEIIDVWDMTRTVALEGVNGNVEVDLPGKEGIALLATKIG